MPRLLRSLFAQDLDRSAYEVIVVDNASRDRTAELARSWGARVVAESIPSRSRARNAGACAARSELIAFTDVDCEAASGWLSALLGCRGRAPLVAGRVEIATRVEPNVVEHFESRWRFDQQAWVHQGWAATANLMVERAAFDAVGGFDPGYRHIGEDVDFCLRAGRAGLPIVYCDDAIIRHEAEIQLIPTLRRAFFHGYSSAEVLKRLGVGHAAWRHPSALLSPHGALRWHGIDPERLRSSERRSMGAIAWLTYASRMAGSVWAALRRVG